MQWQHGSYAVFANGSLTLTPIAVDGRQLLSDPCRKDIAEYTRFNTTERFKVNTVHRLNPPFSSLTQYRASPSASISTTTPKAFS